MLLLPRTRFCLRLIAVTTLSAITSAISIRAQTPSREIARARGDAPVAETAKQTGAYILEYTCDSGQPDTCTNYDIRKKQFQSEGEAINWAEENYRYSPERLLHNGQAKTCYVTYLYPESDDNDRSRMKSVECLTEKESEERFCPEGCWEHHAR